MPIQKLFVATSNPGKLREMVPLAEEFLKNIVPFGDFTVEGRSPPLAEEWGTTFVENAYLKAQSLYDALKSEGQSSFAVIADDSGLAVDALGGAPGLRSARYAGDHVDAFLHIRKLLAELEGKTKLLSERTARYHCGLTLLVDQNPLWDLRSEGTCEGLIQLHPKGKSGFGYDPVFFVPTLGMTFGEADEETKQRLSHRRQAFERLREKWPR